MHQCRRPYLPTRTHQYQLVPTSTHHYLPVPTSTHQYPIVNDKYMLRSPSCEACCHRCHSETSIVNEKYMMRGTFLCCILHYGPMLSVFPLLLTTGIVAISL